MHNNCEFKYRYQYYWIRCRNVVRSQNGTNVETWWLSLQDTMSKQQAEEGRVEVLPVQWRKHLNLEVGTCLLVALCYCMKAAVHASTAQACLHLPCTSRAGF